MAGGVNDGSDGLLAFAGHRKSAALVERARSRGPVAAAVIYPCSVGALEGAREARDAGVIEPMLVGPRDEIERIAHLAFKSAQQRKKKEGFGDFVMREAIFSESGLMI